MEKEKAKIPVDSKTTATEIVKKLVKAGYIAYFAGGWVRDYLLGHPSSDIDIATNAPPEKILDLFPHTILVGLSFGVIIVVVNGRQFEVATFRRDVGYGGGRRPLQIELSTPQEDALRRDFTINGMFYDPLEDTVYDFVKGMEDLKKGIIRTIGNPHERFVEDRLRMVRAVRFACRFGFTIDLNTQDAIMENADTLFPAVAKERIWMEFKKMAESPRFDHALVELHRLCLLQVIFPQLSGVHLNEIKAKTAAFARFPSTAPPILYLMELFRDLPASERADICKDLKTSTRDLKLAELAAHCRELSKADESGNTDLVKWVHFYAVPESGMILEIAAASMDDEGRAAHLKKHKLRQNRLKPHIERAREKKRVVAAAHLQALGVRPGVRLGALLDEAEKLAITFDLHEPEPVLARLKKSPQWQTDEDHTRRNRLG